MSKGVAFVTGASRGIGRGIAIELAKHGCDIAAAATKADPSNTGTGLYEVKARIEELGQRCVPVVGNIASLEDHERMIRNALDALGAIDILINNAGVAPEKRSDVLDATPESYDRVMAINLRGPLFFSQAVARQMIKQVQAGASFKPIMVFITSISANTASPSRVEYCVSKTGLSMVAQTFAVRLAEYGINVYEIRPGIIETDMTSGVREKYDKLIAEGLLLQRRWGLPEDIGKAVAGLVEGYFAYSTGAVIEVGGGFSILRL